MGGMGGFGGADQMMPQISNRQVDHYAKILNLTPDQKDASKALLEGYAQQAAVAGKIMRDAGDKAREQFRESQDPAVFDKVQASMKRFREERTKLDEGFMNDLKAVVTPDQVAKWPEVERATRRDTTLRNGRMSGERVDLLDLTDKQQLPDDVKAQIAPFLSQYEEDLDRELIKRNEVYQNSIDKMMDLRRAGNMDGMQDIIERGREAGIRIRELNRKYARQIMDTLPDEKRASFEREFKKESYPEVYRQSYSDKVAVAATAMPDLSTEQKELIVAMTKKYQTEIEPVNTKYAAAVEENENKFNLMEMAARGWQQEGPLQDIRRQRRDMDKKLLDGIKNVLSEEQRTRLPEDDNRDRQRGGQGAGDGGGRGGQRGPT